MVSFLKRKVFYLGLIRYVLGIAMLMYAIPKIKGTQCIVLPFSAWAQPLETLSGSQLTWAFLGHAVWFQILLGICEFIPAVLLFFRRTTLLGGIILLPSTLAVFLINIALDLWFETKILSACLLALNCSIFLFERQRIKYIIQLITNNNKQLHLRYEVIINIILLAAICMYLFTHGYYNKSQADALTGDWWHGKPNEWILVSENENGINKQPVRSIKSYFMPRGAYSEINDSTNNTTGFIKYTLDESRRTIAIRRTYHDNNMLSHYFINGIYSYAISKDTLVLKDCNNHLLIFKRRVLNSYHR